MSLRVLGTCACTIHTNGVRFRAVREPRREGQRAAGEEELRFPPRAVASFLLLGGRHNAAITNLMIY